MSEPDLPTAAQAPKIRYIIEFSDTISAFAAALVKARPKFLKVERERTARIEGREGKASYGYSYADLGDLLESVVDPLGECGLVAIQAPLTSDNGNVSIETLILHESGEWARSRLTMKSSGNTPQALGSTITYARRYAMFCMLGVAPRDSEDDDGNAGSRGGQQQNRNRGGGGGQQGGGQQQQRQAPVTTDAQRTERAEQNAKPMAPNMIGTIRGLLGTLKFDEAATIKTLTEGKREKLEDLTFGEGSELLKTLQKRKSEAANAAGGAK
jgi:hypothetical protein